MLVELHVHADSAERDPFHLQAESLLGRGFPGAFDRSTGTHHAMPGQSWDLSQYADDLTGGSRPAGGPGNRSIG